MEKFITSFVVESIISAAIFYILFLLLLRKTTNYNFNRFYLLAASIVTTIIPLISFQSSPIKNSFNELGLFTYSKYIPTNFIEKSLDTSYTAAQTGDSTFQVINLVLGIYLFIGLIVLVKLLAGLFRLYLLYKQNPVQKKENYTIVYFEKDYAPFSFFKYIFINHRFNNHEHLNTIIEHEKVHVTKNHSLDVLLLEFISIIQWYNPFIWLTKKRIKEIHEFQVDEKVIAQGFDSNSYFSFLLEKIVGIQAMDFANCFNKSLIKKRIMMMEKTKSKKTRLYKSLLVIPIALLLLAFTIDFGTGTKLISAPNLSDYQTTAEDEIPEGWFKSGRNPLNYTITVEKEGDEDCIVMYSEDGGEKGFGNLMQTFAADDYLNKRIRFSGKIKTEDANFGAMLWMRVDGTSKTKSLAFDNMQGRQPKGTTGWENYEVVLEVPDNATYINIGMMLTQEGKAFFKDLNFEVVDSSVPTTDMHQRDVPDKPVNLDLNK